MKILHVHDHYLPCGGAEVYFADMVKSLEEKGHENVILYAAEKDNKYCGGERKEYFIPPSFGFFSALPLMKRVNTIIKEVNPDIIHIQGFHGYISPLVVMVMGRMRPTIHTAHDAMAFCLNRKKIYKKENSICTRTVGWRCLTSGCLSLFERGTFRSTVKHLVVQELEMSQYRRFHKIIVTSNYMKKELIRHGVSPEKVEVLYCYLNADNGWAHYKQEEERSNTILYVGRIEGNKGVGELIDILSMVQDIPWKAKIVGYGNYESEVRKKINTLGLSDKIDMIGYVPHKDLAQHYAAASVVVVPSYYPEPFGLVGLEAMYFGKPVVAFDVGGINEWLKNNETGFLVEFPNKKLFAERVKLLLRDNALAKKFGENGRARVKSFLSKEGHINRLLQIYQEVINERRLRHQVKG
ncbi:MAG: glycosyltransferase family 4 protein [Candidatus Brocadia sp.]|nr:glycosyltransferase family 4 protein [Candidatus Brocadia sp.]